MIKPQHYYDPFALFGFAYYDRTGICEHLEKMAARGWMIENLGSFYWRYHRIEPCKLHFYVVYLPKAVELDFSRPRGQEELQELCSLDGWELAVGRGSMQIFFNRQEDPVPIETDPVTQVETIRSSMLRNVLPGNLAAAALFLYLICFQCWQFFRDPIDYLSSPSSLFLPLALLPLLVTVISSSVSSIRWIRKARIAAEQGEFLEMKTNRILSALLMLLSVLVVVVMILTSVHQFQIISVTLVLMFLVGETGSLARWLLRKKNYSRKKNFFLLLAAITAATIVMYGVLGYLIIGRDFGTGREPVGTFGYREVYADEIPLRLSDFTEEIPEGYSMEKWGNETLLASKWHCAQWPLTEQKEAIRLDYTFSEIKVPFLYEHCKNHLLEKRQDLIFDGEVVEIDHYEPVDPAPWGAEEVYQLRNSYGMTERYLLCIGNQLVELHLDETPTADQMQKIGAVIASL